MADSTPAAAPARFWQRGFAFLRRRLQGRPDSEHEQALVRIVLTSLAFCALAMWLAGRSLRRQEEEERRKGLLQRDDD